MKFFVKCFILGISSFLSNKVFCQKVNVSIDDENNALAIRYRATGVFRYQSYDVNKDLNLIMFCQTKEVYKYNKIFINELKAALERQNFVTNVHISILYFDYDEEGLNNLKNADSEEGKEKRNCKNAEPIVDFGGNKFSPSGREISYFENDITEKFQLYVDACSKKFSLINDFVSDMLVNNDGNQASYRCIKRINDPSNFIQTLNIIAKVSKMYDEFKKENNLVVSSLKDSIKGLSSRASFNRSISVAPEINTIGFNVRPPDFKAGMNLELNKYSNLSLGLNTTLHYNLLRNRGSLTFGLSYLRSFTSFNLKTLESSSVLVLRNALDQNGDLYNRYIYINSIEEQIKIKSNRFIMSLNYLSSDCRKNRKDKKVKDKEAGWLVGPFGGIDLGTKVTYNPLSSSFTYHGKYPQYNVNDTLFNNVEDFGKEYSFNTNKTTFINSGLTALYGVNVGWFYRPTFRENESDSKKFKYIFSLKAGLTRLITTYSSPNFSSGFPVTPNQQYNSFLFRSNYYKYSLLSLGISFNYFL